MSVEKELGIRSGDQCELCSANGELSLHAVAPRSSSESENCAYLCDLCRSQLANDAELDHHHWRCLNESMWSEVAAVQVLAWRVLSRLQDQGWAQDLLGMLYLEDERLAWAQEALQSAVADSALVHRDSNGAVLEAGDTVSLVKDLEVKGAGFTAKRGTSVRNIRLVADNAEHIEGKVSGTEIVILTKFVKKASA